MKLTGFQCDRCGKYYDKHKHLGPGGHHIAGIGVVTTKLTIKRYDLCDDCIEKVMAWLTEPGSAEQGTH